MKKFFLVIFLLVLCNSFCYAKSKYSKEFIQNFSLCKPFSESRYNVSYHAQSTYEIKGYASDGSGRCVYVETNKWDRGTNTTTCYLNEKQHKEYFNAMTNPDSRYTVELRGMPIVGKREEVVYLKYFNEPTVCQTK